MRARRTRYRLVLLPLAAVLLACTAPTEEADLVIRNATLVIGDGTTVDGGSVAVSDGRIVAVGEDVGAWRGKDEIDAAGKTVLPGLIDSHVHLLDMGLDSAESVARFREERMPGILSAYLDLGITTVRSTGDPVPAILEVREELRSGVLHGPRLMTAGPVLTAVDGHPATTVCRWLFESPDWCRENLVRELPDPEIARQVVAELAEIGVDFIKVVYESDIGVKLDRPILEAIVAEAKSHDLNVIVHGIPGRLAVEAIDAGVGGLVHLPFGTVDVQTVVDSLGHHSIVATAGVVHPFEDPQGILRTPFLPWNDEMKNMHRSMLELVAALWDNGSPLAFGTDTPMFEPRQALRHEISALVEAGLTPSDLLVTATRNAAVALGIDDELGTLEKGKRADLVVVEGKPHVDIDALQDVVLVVKDGIVVVDRR